MTSGKKPDTYRGWAVIGVNPDTRLLHQVTGATFNARATRELVDKYSRNGSRYTYGLARVWSNGVAVFMEIIKLCPKQATKQAAEQATKPDRQLDLPALDLPEMTMHAPKTRKTPAPKAHKAFNVFVVEIDSNMLRHIGAIEARPGATGGELETALSKVGIYAPRGADSVKWINGQRGSVYSAGGVEIVRLREVGLSDYREKIQEKRGTES